MSSGLKLAGIIQDLPRAKKVRPLTLCLLALFAAAALLAWSIQRPSTATSRRDSSVGSLSRALSSAVFVPAVHKLPELTAAGQTTSTPDRRNPFAYADLPPVPVAPPAPPAPPPPPPEIKPQSRLVGTVAQGGTIMALFSLKSDVTPLKEGDVLENRYLVEKINPESVLLKDRSFGNTATISLEKK